MSIKLKLLDERTNPWPKFGSFTTKRVPDTTVSKNMFKLVWRGLIIIRHECLLQISRIFLSIRIVNFNNLPRPCYLIKGLKKTLISLWPSGTICRHKSGSTLAQVKACCLTAPSHYLIQCWLIISKDQWHWFVGNFTWDTSVINQ